MQRVLILGAGFGGLELATRLSEEVADEVEVTLIDQSDSFVFGYSKLDVMFGRETPDAVRTRYRDIVKPSVRVPPGDDPVDRPGRQARHDRRGHVRHRHAGRRARRRRRARADAGARRGRQRVLHGRGRGAAARRAADVRRRRRDHRRARAVLQVPGRAVRGGDDAARLHWCSGACATHDDQGR